MSVFVSTPFFMQSSLLAASAYQENVTQFVCGQLGPETDVLATLEEPHEFLAQIAQPNEAPVQAMLRFHAKTVADLGIGMVPAPVRQAATTGRNAMSTAQRVDAFFAEVIKVMTEGGLQVSREQTRLEIFHRLLNTMAEMAELDILDRDQLTLDSKQLTVNGITRQFLTPIRDTIVSAVFDKIGVDRLLFIEINVGLEEYYRIVAIPDAAVNWTLGEYINAFVGVIHERQT